jgi:hypothetical protein
MIVAFNRIGVKFSSKEQLAKDLQVSEAEYNPFYKSTDVYSYEEIARVYKGAQ